MSERGPNVDERTVEGVGLEWARFDQHRLPAPEFQPAASVDGPLACCRNRSLYTMRAGTWLERRFTRPQIFEMMRAAGLAGRRSSGTPPPRCALGRRGTGAGHVMS